MKGQRAKIKRRYSAWGPRITAITIKSYSEGLLDVGLYEGRHVNGETSLEFVNAVLNPCLPPFNGYIPRSLIACTLITCHPTKILQELIFYYTILTDNAAIHHTREVVDAIKPTGALLIFLLPYSPDLMHCEELFSH